jgi:hypothetical protein
VLAINPANELARRGLERLGGEPSPAPPSPQPKPARQPDPVPSTPPQPAESFWQPDAEPLGPETALPEEPVWQSEITPAGPAPAQPAEDKGKGCGVGWLLWVFVIGMAIVFACAVTLVLAQRLGTGLDLAGSGSPGSSGSSDGQITSVVYENIAAHNAESIDRYIATMHSRSPGYRSLEETLSEMYSTFDLNTTITNVAVLKSSSTRAEVSFVLTTRKVRGPAFRDNRITGVFILRQEDGKWRLYDQEIDDIEYLE